MELRSNAKGAAPLAHLPGAMDYTLTRRISIGTRAELPLDRIGAASQMLAWLKRSNPNWGRPQFAPRQTPSARLRWPKIAIGARKRNDLCAISESARKPCRSP